jgi:hypothetical protein
MDVIGRTAPVMDVIGRTAPVMDVIGCNAPVMDVIGRTDKPRQRTTHDLRIGRTLIHAVLPQDRDA